MKFSTGSDAKIFDEFMGTLVANWREHYMGAVLHGMIEGKVGENQEMKALDIAPLFQSFHQHLKSDAVSNEFDSAFSKLSLK